MTNPGETDLIEELCGDLAPVATVSVRRGRVLLFAAMLAATLAIAMIWGLRPDVTHFAPDPVVLFASGLFAILAIAAGWLVTRMGVPAVGNHYEGWIWPALSLALLPVAALFAAWKTPQLAHAHAVHALGADCLLWGILAGLIPALAMTIWLRRGAPTSPERAGFMIGLVGGASGAFAITLECDFPGIVHPAIWHLAIVGVGAALGRIALPPLLRW